MAADVLLPDWPVKFASVPDIDTAEDRDGGPGCCVLVLKPYVDRAVSVSDVAGYVSLALLDDDAFLGSKVVPAELAMISELGFPTVCELTETLLSDEVTPSSADVTELLRSKTLVDETLSVYDDELADRLSMPEGVAKPPEVLPVEDV
ncbi:hypothetical protein B0A50_00901 [Salinomyces thailandicus]|uniref:Uncharacterized protein n=1 Tax=Salinomyces thailandicus TaxID=706561 RepID=A0A4U0UCZ3_9PEZI|nr:hypothetical protein B0A50_00901 [Salinomyces thailandica]